MNVSSKWVGEPGYFGANGGTFEWLWLKSKDEWLVRAAGGRETPDDKVLEPKLELVLEFAEWYFLF